MLGLRCWGAALVLVLVGAGCGDDDSTPPPSTDAGPGGSDGSMDAGPDNRDTGVPPDVGPPDAGPPPPGELVVTGLCLNDDRSRMLAASPDGALLAYGDCDMSQVVVQEVADPTARTNLGPSVDQLVVEFSPDSTHLLFGTTGSFSVRDVGASAPAVSLSTGTVSEHRFITIQPSAGAPIPAILYSADVGGMTTFALRELADLATERVLGAAAGADPSIALVSDTGRTLVVQTSATSYARLTTETVSGPMNLPFGPDAYALVPAGLTDTHGAAHNSGGGIVYRTLDDGSQINLMAASAVDPAMAVLSLSPGGTEYIYFVADGNVTRHEARGAGGTADTLAMGAAWFLTATPDGSRVVFTDGPTLFSVPAAGGTAAIEVVPRIGATAGVRVAFSPDSSEVAVSTDAAGQLLRARTDMVSTAQMLDGDVFPAFIGYDGNGSHVLWIRRTDPDSGIKVLKSVDIAASRLTPIFSNVDAWVAVPGTSTIAYVLDTELRLLML